ncbi:MAG: RNA polymerase sigma factor [Candidatus Omnitrophota bacterium]
MTTEQLIQKCVNKDRAAWDEFVRRYQGLVARGVRYKLKRMNVNLPKEEFHDIVQEIFLFIWEKERLSRVRNTACIRSWLAMVSVNRTYNYCKNKIFRLERDALSLDEDLYRDRPGVTLGSLLPSGKLNTGKMLESREIKEMLEKEIAKLGDRQQLAFKLNLYDGKTQKDIAKIMSIPENTVATLIRRAKNRLRENLKKNLKEFE